MCVSFYFQINFARFYHRFKVHCVDIILQAIWVYCVSFDHLQGNQPPGRSPVTFLKMTTSRRAQFQTNSSIFFSIFKLILLVSTIGLKSIVSTSYDRQFVVHCISFDHLQCNLPTRGSPVPFLKILNTSL
jgi:hypothetical protein